MRVVLTLFFSKNFFDGSDRNGSNTDGFFSLMVNEQFSVESTEETKEGDTEENAFPAFQYETEE